MQTFIRQNITKNYIELTLIILLKLNVTSHRKNLNTKENWPSVMLVLKHLAMVY